MEKIIANYYEESVTKTFEYTRNSIRYMSLAISNYFFFVLKVFSKHNKKILSVTYNVLYKVKTHIRTKKSNLSSSRRIYV